MMPCLHKLFHSLRPSCAFVCSAFFACSPRPAPSVSLPSPTLVPTASAPLPFEVGSASCARPNNATDFAAVTDDELETLLARGLDPKAPRAPTDGGLPPLEDCRGAILVNDDASPARLRLQRTVGRDARGAYAIVTMDVGILDGQCETWLGFLALVRLGHGTLAATAIMPWQETRCGEAPPPSLVSVQGRDVVVYPTATGNGEDGPAENAWLVLRTDKGRLVPAGSMRRTIDSGNGDYLVHGWTATMRARIVGTGAGIEVEELWTLARRGAQQTRTVLRLYRLVDGKLVANITADPVP